MLSQVSNIIKYLGLKMFFNGLQKTLEEEVTSLKSKMKKGFKEKQEALKNKLNPDKTEE